MLKICCLGSGSKGNCFFIESERIKLLVDAGLNFSDIKSKLLEIGISILDISGVLITHEHTDHIGGLTGFSNSGIPIFAHARAARVIENKIRGLNMRAVNGEFDFYGIGVTSFNIPHDSAGPLGYRLSNGNISVGIATDMGHISLSAAEGLKDCDCVVIEANHDKDMLLNGKYPHALKKRITGGRGHLSNLDCAELLSSIVTPRTKNVWLAHLSEENNLPELAFETVVKELQKIGITEGRDLKIETQKQHEKSRIICFS
ncbi:MAG: MBL fold metallo-hydrolase [Clostridiales bacterium]|nr:MBL fold metallo-hydrolase [Clostridiales bacterium]